MTSSLDDEIPFERAYQEIRFGVMRFEPREPPEWMTRCLLANRSLLENLRQTAKKNRTATALERECAETLKRQISILHEAIDEHEETNKEKKTANQRRKDRTPQRRMSSTARRT